LGNGDKGIDRGEANGCFGIGGGDLTELEDGSFGF
jgi:hypothetical protein